MKRRWKITAIMAAVVCLSSVAVGTARASVLQVQAPYSGCPSGSVCLYKNGNGTGSKVILTLVTREWDDFRMVYFRDGSNANDQVSSVYNNIQYRADAPSCAVLYPDVYRQGYNQSLVRPGEKVDYGSTGSPYNWRFNDIVSSIELKWC